MKYTFILAFFLTLNFTACTTCPEPPPILEKKISYQVPSLEKENTFNKTMGKVALSIRDDQNYNKMSLNTLEKKEWFQKLMFQLWDRQITRDQFIARGVEKYPTHEYEFEFVANGFQKN